MQVKDVMTTKVITVREEQSKQQAARLLAQHRISGLPVVKDDNVLVGLVTEYDMLAKEGKTVGDIMTRGVISVTPDTELEEASHILVHERIKRLPVVEQGRVIGILSRGDVVKVIATRWICYVCGEVIHSEEQPERCPRCESKEIAAWPEAVPPGS
ncbi:MAG TPA: CBS domain-containing protein [Ktedonobacteraceae bacterium]|jgi:CBS domain-containing protein|nr:CBS domain-containing protein [Ktedonobacteraceae bacterium]